MHAWGEMKDDMNKEHVYPSCTPNTTLLSSASVAPPTSSVFYPYEACADFQWGNI